MMAGMAPVMSLGVIAGFAIAYPANVWMVLRQMKHGLMTQRVRKGEVRGKAHASPAASHQHGEGAHASRSGMKPDVTRPQLGAVGLTTGLMLIAGMVAPAFFVNLRLSARDVGGTIMPPGMIMGWDTPGDAMRHM